MIEEYLGERLIKKHIGDDIEVIPDYSTLTVGDVFSIQDFDLNNMPRWEAVYFKVHEPSTDNGASILCEPWLPKGSVQ